MKAIAFGIALAGQMIGLGIALTRRDMTPSENASACFIFLILVLGIALS